MATSTDNFNRSRVTALTTAGLMLAISLADESKIKNAEIFKVSLSSVSKDFILICLIVASSISLISMWLAWRNNAQIIHEAKYGELEGLDVPKGIVEDVQKALRSIDGFMGTVSLVNILPDVAKNSMQKAVAVNSTEIITAVRSLWTEKDAEEAFKKLQEAARMVAAGYYGENPLYQAMSEHIRQTVIARQDDIFGESINNFVITGQKIRSLQECIPAAQTQLNTLMPYLSEINRKLIQYNKFVKNSKILLSVENVVIGLLAPFLLYIIAIAHALGALGLRCFLSAPEFVDQSLGFLRGNL